MTTLLEPAIPSEIPGPQYEDLEPHSTHFPGLRTIERCQRFSQILRGGVEQRESTVIALASTSRDT
jgi:hypothetical protein